MAAMPISSFGVQCPGSQLLGALGIQTRAPGDGAIDLLTQFKYRILGLMVAFSAIGAFNGGFFRRKGSFSGGVTPAAFPGVSVSAFRSWRNRGCHLYLLKTRTAQHRSALRRLKRDCGGCSTPSAHGLSFLGVLLGGGMSFGLADLATLGVIHKLLAVEEELLSSRENELGIAVNALQNLVCQFHGLLFSLAL